MGITLVPTIVSLGPNDPCDQNLNKIPNVPPNTISTERETKLRKNKLNILSSLSHNRLFLSNINFGLVTLFSCFGLVGSLVVGQLNFVPFFL